MSTKNLPSQRQGNQAEEKPTKRRGIKSDVAVYFHQRPGQTIYLKDIMSDLGLEDRQVQSAISQVKADGDPIETVVRGREWIYKPNGDKADDGKKLYVEVGRTKAGTIILESEDGVLGKFVELD